MTDYARARTLMVDNQLRTSGITDRRLLGVMGEVPRETFVPPARQPLAYIDEAHPLNATRKLGPPVPFAKLIQLAGIEHTDHVLDVGCGTGYSAAVIAGLAAQVVAVEDDPALAATARKNLVAVGASNASVSEGSAALPAGEYDVVVVEGTLDQVPQALFDLLKVEGRLVAYVGVKGKVPVAHLFAKSGKGIAARSDFDGRLPPLAKADSDAFVF
jgi:protein-L-isoaspartate(D-aspartate) O-methyltransferase